MKHHYRMKNPTNVDLKLPHHLQLLTDSQLNNVELVHDFDISDNDGRSLRIQHKKFRILNRRLRRETIKDSKEVDEKDNSMDPIKLQENSLDLKSLYTKVRNKRTKQAINKLEQEYKRCKKESGSNQDCMVVFMRMYNLARDINEKMEKMRAIFKDSETLLQTNSTSSSTDSKEHSTKATTATTSTVTTSTTIVDRLISNDSSISGMLKNVEKIEPSKFSWILDSNDYKSSHQEFAIMPDAEINNATTAEATTAETATEALKATTSPTSTTTEIIESIENISLENDSPEELKPKIAGNSSSTTAQKAKESKPDKISWILDGLDGSEKFLITHDYFEDVALKTKLQSTTTSPITSTAISTNAFPSMTDKTKITPISENAKKDQLDLQRKLQFDWILGGKEPAVEITEAYSGTDSTTETSVKTTPPNQYSTKPKPIRFTSLSVDVNSAEALASTARPLTTIAIDSGITTAIDKCKRSSSEDNSCELMPKENNSRNYTHEDHPLDNPNSLENLLESLERIPVETVKVKNKTFDSLDRKDWEKKFQKAILNNQQEILDSFGEFDAKNMAKFGPQLNPVNPNNFGGK